MPIKDAGKKAMRSSARSAVTNMRRSRTMKGLEKEMRELVVAGKKADAQKLMSPFQKAVDKACKKGLIKKNTAARKKSRMAAAITKLS